MAIHLNYMLTNHMSMKKLYFPKQNKISENSGLILQFYTFLSRK